MKDKEKVVFTNFQKHYTSANGGEEYLTADMHIVKNTIPVILNKSVGGKWIALDRNNPNNLFPLESVYKHSIDDWQNGDDAELTICVPPTTQTRY